MFLILRLFVIILRRPSPSAKICKLSYNALTLWPNGPNAKKACHASDRSSTFKKMRSV